MKRLLLISLGLISLVSLSLYSLHVYLLSQIYPAPKVVRAETIERGVLVSVPSKRGMAHGVFIGGNDRLVVLFHGNGASLHEMFPASSSLAKEGFSVLLVEYPGYWLSADSTANESNILFASERLVAYVVREYGFDTGKVTLFGYSLGGAVAISLAANGIGSKLITVDTFTSMDDMISRAVPKALTRIINTEKYDNVGHAGSVAIPVLLLHGDHDNYVPYEMAEKLLTRFTKAELIPIPSNDHATVLRDIPDDVWKRVFAFIYE